MFHGVIHKITLAQFFLRHGVVPIDCVCLWFVSDGTAAASKYYFIVSKLNGLYLDIKYGSKKPGARLIMWTKTGSDNQLWCDDNGRIRSKLNGFCLEIERNYTLF